MRHPEALESLRMLVQALWSTHQFFVDGEPVGSQTQVMDAFIEDRQVSFLRETFK
jgi:hypothetical protein